jgi:hypothetical protein
MKSFIKFSNSFLFYYLKIFNKFSLLFFVKVFNNWFYIIPCGLPMNIVNKIKAEISKLNSNQTLGPTVDSPKMYRWQWSFCQFWACQIVALDKFKWPTGTAAWSEGMDIQQYAIVFWTTFERFKHRNDVTKFRSGKIGETI